MKWEDKVVSQQLAQQLVRHGWTQYTTLSWMLNSEGWVLNRTEDARFTSSIRSDHKLPNEWHYAPDISELLNVPKPYGTLSCAMASDASWTVVIDRPDGKEWLYGGNTLQNALAQCWLDVVAK